MCMIKNMASRRQSTLDCFHPSSNKEPCTSSVTTDLKGNYDLGLSSSETSKDFTDIDDKQQIELSSDEEPVQSNKGMLKSRISGRLVSAKHEQRSSGG